MQIMATAPLRQFRRCCKYWCKHWLRCGHLTPYSYVQNCYFQTLRHFSTFYEMHSLQSIYAGSRMSPQNWVIILRVYKNYLTVGSWHIISTVELLLLTETNVVHRFSQIFWWAGKGEMVRLECGSLWYN